VSTLLIGVYLTILKACTSLVDAIKSKYELNSPDLIDSPARMEKAWTEFLSGYSQSPAVILNKTFKTDAAGIVVVSGIDFVSVCEHHLLPFIGTVSVGYMPKGNKVVGLSKIPRLVDCYSKRLQLQENLGNQIVSAINMHLNPLGAGCIIKAKHYCTNHRGVKKPNAVMTTATLTGIFKEATVRQEFYEMLKL
jgi:GTP cyclohydrolase I